VPTLIPKLQFLYQCSSARSEMLLALGLTVLGSLPDPHAARRRINGITAQWKFTHKLVIN
jgi:hypothetical protein